MRYSWKKDKGKLFTRGKRDLGVKDVFPFVFIRVLIGKFLVCSLTITHQLILFISGKTADCGIAVC